MIIMTVIIMTADANTASPHQAALASLKSATSERGEKSISQLQKSIAECKALSFTPRELATAEQRLSELQVCHLLCLCQSLVCLPACLPACFGGVAINTFQEVIERRD